MLRLVVGWLGTLASVIGLIATLWPSSGNLSTSQGIALGIAIVFMLGMLGFDLREQLRNSPKRFKEAQSIKDYMYNWISSAGRVVIFTRDMSWAGEERIKNLLLNKARARELSVCLPEPIPLTNELGQAGARVITYGRLDYVPTARFTIINDERMDSCVAIGRRLGEYHVIEEFAAGSHPVYSVAKDLVEIIRRISEGEEE